MLVCTVLVWLMLGFCPASCGPAVAEFDAAEAAGLSVNERNEVERWRDARRGEEWSMSGSSNKPLLVRDGVGRPHVHFCRNQRLVLNKSTPVHMATAGAGSTLAVVMKNEFKGSHVMFGGAGNSANAQIGFDNPTTIRLHPPANLFSIHDSTDAFHAYIIRAHHNTIEVFQDGELVAAKRTDRSYGKADTMMHCFGCWFSKHYLQGRVTYLSFYEHAVGLSDLSTLHSKLKQITADANSVITSNTTPRARLSSSEAAAASPAPRESADSDAPREAAPMRPEPPRVAVIREGSSERAIVQAVNGSLVISTQPLLDMLRNVNGSIVVPQDTMQAAVTGLFVIGLCCLTPWCLLLLCVLHKCCIASPSLSPSRAPRFHSPNRFHPYHQLQQQQQRGSSASYPLNSTMWRRPKQSPSRRSAGLVVPAYSVLSPVDNDDRAL